MLKEKFGASKVLASDTFSSVTSGLGIIAHGIEQGQIEAEAHTQVPRLETGQEPLRPNVSPVNLSLLQRRLAAQEASDPDDASGLRRLVTLWAGNQLRITSLPGVEDQASVQLHAEAGRPLAILAAGIDEQLLMVTSRYRFLLTTARHLLDLAEVGLDVAAYFQLKPQEELRAMARWSLTRNRPLLLLLTTSGYVRTYELSKMVESIEGPAPYQFDQRLPGVPATITGAGEGTHLVLMLDSGRSVRYQVCQMPIQGVQAINRRDDEQLIGGLAASEAEQVLLLTGAGYGRRLQVNMVPIPPKANSRGRVLVARRPLSGLARLGPDRQAWAVTNRRWHRLDPDRLPAATEDSTRTNRLVKLAKGERVVGAVSL
jgi:DNA gyrase/topoisomerase IV subunit A